MSIGSGLQSCWPSESSGWHTGTAGATWLCSRTCTVACVIRLRRGRSGRSTFKGFPWRVWTRWWSTARLKQSLQGCFSRLRSLCQESSRRWKELVYFTIQFMRAVRAKHGRASPDTHLAPTESAPQCSQWGSWERAGGRSKLLFPPHPPLPHFVRRIAHV